MLHSIRWRIAVPYFVLIAILMTGLAIILSRLLKNSYMTNLDNQLSNNAYLIADNLTTILTVSPDSEINFSQLAKHWSELIQARVTIISEDGVVIGESHQDITIMDNHLNRPEVRDALSIGKGQSTRFSNSVKYEMMYVAIRLDKPGKPSTIVRVALPTTDIGDKINRLYQTLAATTLITLLLAFIIGSIIAEITSRPVRQLTEIAVQLRDAALRNQPIPLASLPTSKDEVGQLADAFNLMSTQLHHQIEALEEEQRKISAVLDKMTDGILIVDREGIVQLINPAVGKMLQEEIDHPIGRSLIEVLRHHQFIEIWQHARRSGEIVNSLIEFSIKKLYIQSYAIPLDQALPGNTLLLLQNLTHQRYLETVRQDFISNVSHELRTPLASLKALTETLQEGALEDTSVARRFLSQMETEVDALGQMVSELLELSRIESGQVPLRLSIVHPTTILKGAIERLELQAERAGLKISLDCPEHLPDVLVDPPRLEQVVVNLLHNAIKFTPVGGEIKLTAAPHNDMVVFSVHDTGIGIHPDDLPRIFERFFKADRARTSGGTGLGLAISRHTVQAHGGNIWVESIESKGSTFHFTIPQAN